MKCSVDLLHGVQGLAGLPGSIAGQSHRKQAFRLLAGWMVALAFMTWSVLDVLMQWTCCLWLLWIVSGPQVPAFFAYEELRVEPQTTAHPGT